VEIRTLEDLTKLLELCRTQGVKRIKLDTVEFDLGDLPQSQVQFQHNPDVDPANPYANFPIGELTPEQLMFYSAGGVPEDDPELIKGDMQ
jgi:hypothetical protein